MFVPVKKFWVALIGHKLQLLVVDLQWNLVKNMVYNRIVKTTRKGNNLLIGKSKKCVVMYFVFLLMSRN